MSTIADTLCATELADALAKGRIGSRDLPEHQLARIDRRNAAVIAVIALNAAPASDASRLAPGPARAQA